MKDFIHGALVKAASTDGIETMLKGAGIGAGANVGIGAVQGDFDVIGNAFSGAALGGIGGAGMKFGANRYAGNLMRQADGIAEAGGKKVGMFTNPGENHALSFMGGDANTERFAKMAREGAFDGKGYSAGAASLEAAEIGKTSAAEAKTVKKPSASTPGTTRTSSGVEAKNRIEEIKGERQQQIAARSNYSTAPLINKPTSRRGYDSSGRAEKKEKVKRDSELLRNRKPTHGMATEDVGSFMSDVPDWKMKDLQRYIPKLDAVSEAESKRLMQANMDRDAQLNALGAAKQQTANAERVAAKSERESSQSTKVANWENEQSKQHAMQDMYAMMNSENNIRPEPNKQTQKIIADKKRQEALQRKRDLEFYSSMVIK